MKCVANKAPIARLIGVMVVGATLAVAAMANTQLLEDLLG